MSQATVGIWLHTEAPRGEEILQLLADCYGVEPITPDQAGHARLNIKAPEDIPAYLAVMATLEASARDWEEYITVLKLPA